MRKLLPILAFAALLGFPFVAYATPTSWDFASGILQPFISQATALIKGDHFQATSTTQASVLPLASTTVTSANTLCLSTDCRTVWPSGGSGGGLSTTTPWNIGDLVQVVSNGVVRSIATSTLGLFSSLFTFQASTTASIPSTAIPRLTVNKLSDTISVKDFGAKGDGITDDTAAIQAALNYASTTLNNMGTVYFPAGTYNVSATLLANSSGLLDSGAVIKATASMVDLLDVGNGISATALGNGDPGAPNPNVYKIVWQGGTLDGQDKVTGAVFHDFSPIFGATVRDIKVYNAPLYAFDNEAQGSQYSLLDVERSLGTVTPAGSCGIYNHSSDNHYTDINVGYGVTGICGAGAGGYFENVHIYDHNLDLQVGIADSVAQDSWKNIEIDKPQFYGVYDTGTMNSYDGVKCNLKPPLTTSTSVCMYFVASPFAQRTHSVTNVSVNGDPSATFKQDIVATSTVLLHLSDVFDTNVDNTTFVGYNNFATGTAAFPGYAYSAATTTGMFLNAVGDLGFSVLGTKILDLLTGTSTFTSNLSVPQLAISGLASGCAQIGTGGYLTSTGSACGSGGGAVSSVSNSDSTLTISPTTGAVVASLNLANPNTWTGLQTFGAAASTTELSASGQIFGTANGVGSASAPSYSFSNNPNYGIYQTGTSIGFTINGTLRASVGSAGVSDAAANSPRMANSTSFSTTVPVFLPNQSDTTTGFSAGVSGNLDTILGGIETSRWTPTGYGIGTSTPGALFGLGGSALIGGNLTATGTLSLLPLATAAGSFLAVDPSGKVIATTTPSGGGTNYFTNSGAFTYLSTGTNLGVGSTTPYKTLGVSGGFAFDGTANSVIGAVPSITLPIALTSSMVSVATSTQTTQAALTISNDYEGSVTNNVRGLESEVIWGPNATANNTTNNLVNGGGLRNTYETANNSIGFNVLQAASIVGSFQSTGTLASTTNASLFYAGQIGPSQLTAGNTVKNYYSYRAEPGTTPAGTITNYAGLAINQPVIATNNTEVMIGTSTNPVGNFGFYQYPGDTYTNTLAGNLGVGTTSPVDLLTVSGTGNSTAIFNTSAANSAVYEQYQRQSSNFGFLGIENSTGSSFTTNGLANAFVMRSANSIELITNGNSALNGLTVATTGFVGIGTTTPAAALSIVGGLFASTTATSTFFGGGINLVTATGNTGCFAINGVCISGGSTYTAGTGLTLTTGAFSVNTSQNISTLSNLTSNGLIKTSGSTGALSIAAAGTDYQAPISLTTTGSSGAATFIGNVLNIPNYTGGGSASTTLLSDINNWSGLQKFNANATTSELTATGNNWLSLTRNTYTLLGTTTPVESINSNFASFVSVNNGFAGQMSSVPSALSSTEAVLGIAGSGSGNSGDTGIGIMGYVSDNVASQDDGAIGVEGSVIAGASAGTAADIAISASVTGAGASKQYGFYSQGAPNYFQLNTGIGTSTPWGMLSVAGTGSATVPLFVVSSTTASLRPNFEIDPTGHIITSGPKPAISGGTSTVVGNDNNGTVTVIGTLLTSVTITFSTAWATAPDCTMSDNSTGITADITSISTTQVVFGFSTGINSGTVWYQCVGHQ